MTKLQYAHKLNTASLQAMKAPHTEYVRLSVDDTAMKMIASSYKKKSSVCSECEKKVHPSYKIVFNKLMLSQ